MHTNLWRLGVGLLTASIALVVPACDDDTLSPENVVFVEDAFSFRLAAENRSRVSVQGINGRIEISGHRQIDSLIVAGERRVGSSSLDDAESHLDSLEVLATDLGDTYRIETRQPTPADGRQYVVDYELTVPDTMQLAITSANGPIDVSGVRDSVSIATANGSVTLSDVEGSAAVGTANGGITAEIGLPTGGSIDLSTANGQITLRIPTTTSATIDASVGIGTIRVSGLTVQDEERTLTTLRGTLGAGEGLITLRTGNGDITIEGF